MAFAAARRWGVTILHHPTPCPMLLFCFPPFVFLDNIYANSFCCSKDMQEFKFVVLWLWLRITMLSECFGFWWWQPLLKGTNVRRRQWCANVVRIAMLSECFGFWWWQPLLKGTNVRRRQWCANVVRIAMLSVLGFDDSSYCCKEQIWSKKKTGLRCTDVVRNAMLSVLGFDDGSHCCKEQIWSKKKTGLRCTDVVRNAILSVLGFDDGSHCWKEQIWSKKMHLRWCANVVDYAQL